MTQDKQPEKEQSPYVFWTSAEDQHEAFENTAGNVDSYDGIMSASASRRSYIDIEPNISVRPDFLKDDYYRFRPLEEPGSNFKQSMSMCMKAYDRVGIVKNVIDLMGDFASQGIQLNHPNKRVEKFYRKWWTKVGGTERSERFLNMLYRCGNVLIYKRYGKITRKDQREMSKGKDALIVNKKPIIVKKTIPFRYDFLNPMQIDIEGGYAANFSGDPKYKMKISNSLRKSFEKNAKYVDQLPPALKKAVLDKSSSIELDTECLEVFHYKKDDWELWANPMVNAIIDDIMMLEKMKLADMSALDGAISNIRLWRLGNLDHKILPNKGAIDKLRNILASNVGGGTMDLVWGPEIDFKESNTQIYKFLGSEKYQPVLNSIYAGLGIPPTLTGLAGQSGGFTNNFISLKTLIERLEYGRGLLAQFWQKEIENVQKAMGFTQPATIHFDHMLLSDEVAEKNLLVKLVEEDIISIETVRERLGEDNSIEEKRIQVERKKRDRKAIPPKASPYHNANLDSDYKKIALQKGEIGIDDVTDLTPKSQEVESPQTPPSPAPPQQQKEVKDNGRPPFSKDTKPRKQKRVLPKTTPGQATVMIWANEAQKQIANIVNPALLSHYEKKNLRELSKAELLEMEDIKFTILSNLQPHEEINSEKIAFILEKNPQLTAKQKNIKTQIYTEWVGNTKKAPSIDELRQINNVSYSLNFFDEK
tara:strand:+ start:4166 stop:6274 length:2109 start_codon:yes stop_codon:yes gene_type:complete